jgi:hypothetical protein
MTLAPNTPTYSQSAAEAQSSPSPWSLRCGLTSFERPKYFCGHLLTDTDLTLEQRYFREKTKLYHRELDGQGIVSGLRLTCDHSCSGSVLISRGYAIDNCGNDLILAERTSFDVVGRLIEKRLIAQESSPELDTPERPKTECHFQQCFYITISYQEEEADFAAPLVAGCQPTLSECEATRIRETVQLDVVDKLPREVCTESQLKRRLESCFKIFSEGPFAQALRKHHDALREIIAPPAAAASSKASEHRHSEYHKLFFELRGLLLLYFNQHPDKYHCTIEHEIRKVRFPEVHKKSEKAQEAYLEELRDAFSSLLGLAWQHAVGAALGEFVPSCHEASETCGILLGTVVVENDRVIRVCNCPRSYVWSFANFPEVLLATTLGGLACKKETKNQAETEEEKRPSPEICCRDFDFDLECFLQWLHLNHKAPFHAGSELVHWLETLGKSLREGFDFTDPCNFSSRIFEGMEEKKATEFLKAANLQSRVVEAPLEMRAPDLASFLRTAGLATGDEPIVLAVKDGVVSSAVVEQSELYAQIHHLQNQINNLRAQLERLQPPRTQGGPPPASGPRSA